MDLHTWKASISQQFAMMAAGFCLAVSLALVALGAFSSHHLQRVQQEEFGNALAQQIAGRVGGVMETGDLLSIAAELQRFVESSAAEKVAVFDIEGNAMGQAGHIISHSALQFTAPVFIERDTAGEVIVTIGTDTAATEHLRFLVSLLGLAILLSLAVFAIAKKIGQQMARRLGTLTAKIALEDEPRPLEPGNELAQLGQAIDALPMDLLRTRAPQAEQTGSYQTSALLYLHLNSLANYVDTLDENSLHRYTNRIHQIIYAAAGFYGGEIRVTRQFGLTIYFEDDNSSGSPAFRASACAWLVRAVSQALQEQMPLSLGIAMAIAPSETGAGDEHDIYPGLYVQHTLDELHALSSQISDCILLALPIAEDVDVAGRLESTNADIEGYKQLLDFSGAYRDLLERQLQLILRRLSH